MLFRSLIWKKQGKFALAHCLLPYPSNLREFATRYVVHAIPQMLEQLGVKPEDIEDIEAVVAGGAQMMDFKKTMTAFVVGEENLKTAKKCLNELRIKIIAFESGGEQGTKMSLDCSTGKFVIEKIPKAA